MVSLAERRRAAKHLEAEFEVSERRSCQVVEIARSAKHRPSGRTEEVELVIALHRLSECSQTFLVQLIPDFIS